MSVSLAFSHDSPTRGPVQRSRFARNGKLLDMKDAKVALDFILRPSFQLWKLAHGRRNSMLTTFKRSSKTVTLDDDASSSSSSITPKKKVRFHDRPVTISRKRFFERGRKDSTSSPPRPCLVIRAYDDIPHEQPKPKPPLEEDCGSIYEDCLSEHPSFLADIHVLERDERADTRQRKYSRRSEFYKIESGIATFDRTGYANYCLSMWLDKQREAARSTQKLVFEDPALLPWPSRTLPQLPPPSPSKPPCPMPTLPAPIRSSPRSFPLRIWRLIEDEVQNAIFVLIIGLFIHLCLFLFLLYDILTRGLIPSDD